MIYTYDYFVRNFEEAYSFWGVQELFFQLHTKSYMYVNTTEEEIKKWRFYSIRNFIRSVMSCTEYDKTISKLGYYPIDEAYEHFNHNVVAVIGDYLYNRRFIYGFLVYDGDLSKHKYSNYKNEAEYKRIKEILEYTYKQNIKVKKIIGETYYNPYEHMKNHIGGKLK